MKKLFLLSLFVSSVLFGQVTDTGVNVGIGDSTPTYKLDVNGTGRFTSNLLIGDPNGARTEINTSTNHKVYAPTNKKTIDLDGNYHGGGFVGVYRADTNLNYSNPVVYMWANSQSKFHNLSIDEYKLDGVDAVGLQLISQIQDGDSQAITGLELNTSNSVVVIGDVIGYEKNKGYGLVNKFKTKLENDLYLTSGNLGIGTTTPDSKLTVAGNIHAQEVKVTVNAGADFVFNADYKLPPLKEVEQFIKENKHLPEIASEKEMQDNGLLLAKMNIKLLQKIEELTLYTIQQQKLIEAQAETIKEIQEKLKK